MLVICLVFCVIVFCWYWCWVLVGGVWDILVNWFVVVLVFCGFCWRFCFVFCGWCWLVFCFWDGSVVLCFRNISVMFWFWVWWNLLWWKKFCVLVWFCNCFCLYVLCLFWLLCGWVVRSGRFVSDLLVFYWLIYCFVRLCVRMVVVWCFLWSGWWWFVCFLFVYWLVFC